MEKNFLIKDNYLMHEGKKNTKWGYSNGQRNGGRVATGTLLNGRYIYEDSDGTHNVMVPQNTKSVGVNSNGNFNIQTEENVNGKKRYLSASGKDIHEAIKQRQNMMNNVKAREARKEAEKQEAQMSPEDMKKNENLVKAKNVIEKVEKADDNISNITNKGKEVISKIAGGTKDVNNELIKSTPGPKAALKPIKTINNVVLGSVEKALSSKQESDDKNDLKEKAKNRLENAINKLLYGKEAAKEAQNSYEELKKKKNN